MAPRWFGRRSGCVCKPWRRSARFPLRCGRAGAGGARHRRGAARRAALGLSATAVRRWRWRCCTASTWRAARSSEAVGLTERGGSAVSGSRLAVLRSRAGWEVRRTTTSAPGGGLGAPACAPSFRAQVVWTWTRRRVGRGAEALGVSRQAGRLCGLLSAFAETRTRAGRTARSSGLHVCTAMEQIAREGV